MNIMKTMLVSCITLCSATTFAQDSTLTGNNPAYGDNPNLAKVLAVKAQETLQNTANTVDDATKRGIAKIKPSVDSAWQNTKEFTNEKAVALRDGARQGVDTAVKSVQHAKQNLVGAGGVPIERGSLSQPNPTTAPAVTASPAPTTASVALPVQENSVNLETAQSANTTLASQNQAPEAEPTIQRQSVALPNSGATTSSPAVDDSDAGVPR